MRARGFIVACALALAFGASLGLSEAADDPAFAAEAAAFEAPSEWRFDPPVRFHADARVVSIRDFIANPQEFAAVRSAASEAPNLQRKGGDCISHEQTPARRTADGFARAGFFVREVCA